MIHTEGVRKSLANRPRERQSLAKRVRELAAMRPCGRRCVSGSPEANARHTSSHGHGQQRAWEERVATPTDVLAASRLKGDAQLPQLYHLRPPPHPKQFLGPVMLLRCAHHHAWATRPPQARPALLCRCRCGVPAAASPPLSIYQSHTCRGAAPYADGDQRLVEARTHQSLTI